jgi:putative phosphonate metabolism protein
MLTRDGRFAVYHAPPEGTPLADLAARWLGRDAATGAPLARPALPGLEPARAEVLTESPRFYGFHGTLKAPFALAGGATAGDLIAAVDRFAAGRCAFDIPPLRVRALGAFVALMPSAPAPALDDLAAACVRAFESLRAPPDAAELARRRAAGLTPAQQGNLERWGYPYVMDDFRFHMTLTGRIADDAERAAVAEGLAALFAPVLAGPESVAGLAVFHQPDRRSPFRLVHRAPFGQSGPHGRP